MSKSLESRLEHLKNLTSDKLGRGSRFSYVDINFVIALLEEGLTINQVTDIYNCSYQALRHQLVLSNPEFNARKYSGKVKQSREKSQKAAELYRELKSSVKVGKALGLSQPSVLRRLKTINVKRRSKYREDIVPEDVVRVYQECGVLKYTAEFFNTDTRLVKRRLKVAGVNLAPKYKCRPKRSELPIEQILEKYDRRGSVTEIAEDYATSFLTIRGLLVDNGREIERKREGRKRREDITPEKVVEAYKRLKTFEATAEFFHTDSSLIKRRLAEAEETTDKKMRSVEKIPAESCLDKDFRRRNNIPVKTVLRRYDKRDSITGIAKDYNASCRTIRKILVDSGREIDSNRAGCGREDITPEKAARLYRKYERVNLAAEKLGTSYVIIKDRLDKAGIKIDKSFIYEAKRTDIPENTVVRLYKTMSLIKIASKYNAHAGTIRRILIKNGQRIRKPRERPQR